MKKERESFKSRLGFILLSAGCAIGIGNVWRFPYVVGNSGGGAFVLIYLVFLAIMGIPILTMEFSIGRASRKSAVKAYQELEKPGDKWHIHGIVAMIGTYVLMMFYTTVSGWMLYYCYSFSTGKFREADTTKVKQIFCDLLMKPDVMLIWMVIIVVLGFFICSFGLQNGVERISKGIMLTLLAIMIVLAINSFSLNNGLEGIKFYLRPDWGKVKEVGFLNIIVSAMNQSFFTLSIGIGAMTIFGSYLDKEHTLLGESTTIALLDTFVALVSGLIIFPACFSFGISPDSGPSLIFITLPNVFLEMRGGQIWGSLFFLFMSFASFSTIIAVFENILSCSMDLFGMNRKKAAILNTIVIILFSIPCILGFNLWSGVHPLGGNSTFLDLEDFIVSNLLLPIGSLIYLLFCNSRFGWGFEKFRMEANEGKGMNIPKWARIYFAYILPLFVLLIMAQGIVTTFFKK